MSEGRVREQRDALLSTLSSLLLSGKEAPNPPAIDYYTVQVDMREWDNAVELVEKIKVSEVVGEAIGGSSSYFYEDLYEDAIECLVEYADRIAALEAQVKRIESPPARAIVCKCLTLPHKLTGSGCEICNKDAAYDYALECIEDRDEQIVELSSQLSLYKTELRELMRHIFPDKGNEGTGV